MTNTLSKGTLLTATLALAITTLFVALTTNSAAATVDRSDYDLTDADLYAEEVNSITRQYFGKIKVNYSDGTSEVYTPFDAPWALKKTKVLSYNDTGHLVALHPNGKEMKLVNAYTGEVIDTLTISDKEWKNRSMKLLDVLADDSTEVVLTMKKHILKKSGRIGIITVDTTTETLTLVDSEAFTDKTVRVKRTKLSDDGMTINLRNSLKQVSKTVTVNDDYSLEPIE